jgi:hypothetical protein
LLSELNDRPIGGLYTAIGVLAGCHFLYVEQAGCDHALIRQVNQLGAQRDVHAAGMYGEILVETQ